MDHQLEMDREISVRYTPQLVKTAVRCFWFRQVGWSTFISVCLVFAAFVYLLIARDRSWVYSHWGPNWFLVVMIVFGLLLLFCVVFIKICLRSLKEALEELAKRKSAVVVWRFTEGHISTRSDLATVEISWELIKKVWRFPEVWLLFFSKDNYMTLPLQYVDNELRQFIAAKVTANGGAVT
jgi:hypothetical protein